MKDKAALCAAVTEDVKALLPDWEVFVNFDANYSD